MRTREKPKHIKSTLSYERGYMDTMADTAIKIGDLELAKLILDLKVRRKSEKSIDK